jgi:hypothetical protein
VLPSSSSSSSSSNSLYNSSLFEKNTKEKMDENSTEIYFISQWRKITDSIIHKKDIPSSANPNKYSCLDCSLVSSSSSSSSSDIISDVLMLHISSLSSLVKNSTLSSLIYPDSSNYYSKSSTSASLLYNSSHIFNPVITPPALISLGLFYISSPVYNILSLVFTKEFTLLHSSRKNPYLKLQATSAGIAVGIVLCYNSFL